MSYLWTQILAHIGSVLLGIGTLVREQVVTANTTLWPLGFGCQKTKDKLTKLLSIFTQYFWKELSAIRKVSSDPFFLFTFP